MQKPIKIKIDTITKQTLADYSNIRKGDTLIMTINLYQNSISLDVTDQTVKLILRKADGYSIEKTITGAGNVLIVELDEQATLATGIVQGEIQLSDTNGTSISNWFTYEVRESLGSDIVTKSTDYIETLQDIQETINDYKVNKNRLIAENTDAVTNNINLGNTNETATNLKTELETDIIIGTTLKSNLETESRRAESDIGALQGLDIVNEIENARGTYENLELRLDDSDTEIVTINDSLSKKANQLDLNATNANVSANSTNITNHIADLATDSDGAHGFKIEVGNFTPTFSSGNYTLSVQTGRYQRTGKLVSFQIALSVSAVVTAGSGVLTIQGLPFSALNTSTLYPVTIIQIDKITFTGQIKARLSNNTIVFELLTSAAVATQLAYSGLVATSAIYLGGYYEIA